MKKILCVGDGFGKGHIWPMWPQLLQQLVDNCSVDNFCEIGAGNEFISNRIMAACEKEDYNLVLVQWAMSTRLDIINKNQNNLLKKILKDTTYSKKYSNVKVANRSWWLSSNSEIDYVKDYHEIYITQEQSKLRSINQIKLIELYLKQKEKLDFYFFSSYDPDFINLPESRLLDWSKWCSHNNRYIGMQEYKQENFKKYDDTEVQPQTIVQLMYLKNIIFPKIGINISENKINQVLKNIKK